MFYSVTCSANEKEVEIAWPEKYRRRWDFI
jgi:hypothetical protein